MGLWYSLFGGHTESPGARAFLSVVASSFVLLGLSGFGSIYRCRVTLFADRIQVQGLFTIREFSREELRGWRIIPNTPPMLVLQPKTSHAKAVKTSVMFAIDEQLGDWLAALPCLDEVESKESADEILQDNSLGLTESDRTLAYDEARNTARAVSLPSIIITLWAFFYPHPYTPLMYALIALPCIAVFIMARSRGLIRADEIRNDLHPSVAYALMFPGLALALRAVMDIDVFSSVLLVSLCLLIGSAFVLAIIKMDPTVRKRKASLAGLAFGALCYAYGAVIQADVLLDRSTPAYYSATVQNKHIVHGKHTEYDLTLGPWGPKTAPNDIEVRPETYSSIQNGDAVQLGLRRGALGIHWYYLHDLQPATNH